MLLMFLLLGPIIRVVKTMIGWIKVWVVAVLVVLALRVNHKKQNNNPYILLMFLLLGPGPT